MQSVLNLIKPTNKEASVANALDKKKTCPSASVMEYLPMEILPTNLPTHNQSIYRLRHHHQWYMYLRPGETPGRSVDQGDDDDWGLTCAEQEISSD